MRVHKVVSGDCIHSIADAHGHFWETVWSHPDNSDLRRKRETPSVLEPGDEVAVPEIRVETEPAATEKKHRFRRRGVPVSLRIVVKKAKSDEEAKTSAIEDRDPDALDLEEEDQDEELLPEEPWPDAEYLLSYDGIDISGITDGDGMVEISLPPSVKRAKLVIRPGTQEEMTIPIEVGGLNPIATLSGVKQRLRNLGYGLSDIDEEEDIELRHAIRAFQLDQQLEATGELSDDLRNTILTAHGS
ncbi:MAG TPA: peptidoglycan-binding domain-containing protein [Woeseiaceae bacterium]|nr:peptidoglycan-binding domain-containing protein [Woeseiaceae bacterium]